MRQHETKAKEIEQDRAALERCSQAEDVRWEKQKEKLEAALSPARHQRYLTIQPSSRAFSLASFVAGSENPNFFILRRSSVVGTSPATRWRPS